MAEAAFPILGAAFVLLVVLPLSSLVAKGWLSLLERGEGGGPLHGLGTRYWILVGHVALPLAWFLTAGLHQLAPGRATLACLFTHEGAELCFEPGLFAATLLFLVALLSYPTLRKQQGGKPQGRPLSGDHAGARRITALIAERRSLRSLLGRVQLFEDPSFALGTFGLLRPKVALGAPFASELTDEALASALAHEAEHLRAFDPLRYLLLHLALSINPFGSALLRKELTRWVGGREAHCDRDAVLGGASPLALADAILSAARQRRPTPVGLASSDVAILRLRIEMLLAFAERPPQRCCLRDRPWGLLLGASIAVALLVASSLHTALLDAVHEGAELAVLFIIQ